jgi:hypothetical protein
MVTISLCRCSLTKSREFQNPENGCRGADGHRRANWKGKLPEHATRLDAHDAAERVSERRAEARLGACVSELLWAARRQTA